MRKNQFKNKGMLKSLGLMLIIISMMLFGSLVVNEVVETMGNNTGKNLPIYSVETDKKVVSISFDAAWGNEDTKDILDILDKYNVKTTFFLVGGWVDKFPEDVKLILEKGHDIGNHSNKHPHMTKLSTEQCQKELQDAYDKVYNLTGYSMDLFRCPYGDYDDKVLNAARAKGYYTIQWDVDSLDWKEYGVKSEIKEVLEHKDLRNGSIILFHNDTKYTPEALPAIIEGLQGKGYTIVPISELIIREDYKMDHTGRQFANEAF